MVECFAYKACPSVRMSQGVEIKSTSFLSRRLFAYSGSRTESLSARQYSADPASPVQPSNYWTVKMRESLQTRYTLPCVTPVAVILQPTARCAPEKQGCFTSRTFFIPHFYVAELDEASVCANFTTFKECFTPRVTRTFFFSAQTIFHYNPDRRSRTPSVFPHRCLSRLLSPQTIL